jgi:hypothetical protein
VYWTLKEERREDIKGGVTDGTMKAQCEGLSVWEGEGLLKNMGDRLQHRIALQGRVVQCSACVAPIPSAGFPASDVPVLAARYHALRQHTRLRLAV